VNYIEIAVGLIPGCNEEADLIPHRLEELGFEGFIEDRQNLRAYIPQNRYDSARLKDILRLKNGKALTFKEKTILQQNWNLPWESIREPVVVDNRYLVKEPFHRMQKKYAIEITIEAGMAFGTGHHESTQLMISEMLKMNLRNKSMLDAGCGTAILSILADKMAAGSVLAVDSDLLGIASASENIRINHAEHVMLMHADATLLSEGNFDLILANNEMNTTIAYLDIFTNLLKPGGILMISGMLKKDAEKVIFAAAEKDWNFRPVASPGNGS
jgi:ribosomal protein L11 methyltransferase